MHMKTPLGFSFAGTNAGIKVKKPDLCLILSEVPASAAACVTQLKGRAAAVEWTAERVPQNQARAIIANSGCANALTGEQGIEANRAMATSLAESLGLPPDAVLTCSTGGTGIHLPVAKIQTAIPGLIAKLSPDPQPSAEAILTTDTCIKMTVREAFLGGKRIRLLGIAKGTGMIHPNMATMFAFLLTDAAVESNTLNTLLRSAVDETFNMLTVDGDTSTNDTVIALANGLAANASITSPESEEGQLFGTLLTDVCRDLTRMMAADGEGANRLITVHLQGAATREDARALARAVVESNLVKAAFFGADPNWGRVLTAVGARAAERNATYDVKSTHVSIQGVPVFNQGTPQIYDADALRSLMRSDEVQVTITLGLGPHEATAWGCDLSYDYVRINAEYAAVLVESPDGPVRLDQRLDTKTPDLKAEALLQALRYIERFSGTLAVIKYGGAAMVRADLKDSFSEDLRLLQAVGLRPIVVHGGGPEISKTLDKMGQRSEFIDGLRVTDENNLKVIEMVLTGQINKEIVASLARAGARAVGLSGKDGNLISARKLQMSSGKDLGYVGEVVSVDPDVLTLLMSKGYIPVLSPLGLGQDGHTYNINADAVAAEIAIACGAKKLIYLSDVPGILSQGLLVSELSAEELELRLHDGSITGGMLPKAQAVLRSLTGGVESVHIIDGRVPHNIVAELFTARGVGTMIRPGAPQEGEEVPLG